MNKSQRVSVYVDGFNFYHAIRKLTIPNKYVDLQKLSQDMLQPHQELVAVNYFSAFATWRTTAYPKHLKYVRQLQGVGVNTVMAHFKTKPMQCASCKARWQSHEEKETDIRIALNMFEDAMDDVFDLAIVISADSDLVPVIDRINTRFKDKFIFLAVPPKRYKNARDLIRVSTTAKEITVGQVKKALF